MRAALKPVRQAEAPLAAPEDRTQLRVLTCGSVDDGKSTLLGRLLFDTNAVLDDQLSALDQESRRWGTQGEGRDYALLLDGLSAEREQGITIDVAYRYFSTKRRSFIVADTPGHEQYTRNMATGASTADLAIILIDARKGVLAQTRRHAFIVATLGIRHAVLAINKMDLVGFSRDVWQRIADEFRTTAAPLGFESIVPIPICARDGDNIASVSERMPWFEGPSLLEHLETVTVTPQVMGEAGFCLPVQLVLRPDSDFRGYAGTIASGTLHSGQEVIALPSQQRARIARLVTAGGDRAKAGAGEAVTVTLTEEIDVSRGDVLADAENAPVASTTLSASLLWMELEALLPGREFALHLGPATANARVVRIRHAIDIQTYAPLPATTLRLNEIGLVDLVLDKPLVARPYREDRTLGALILVDRLTNQTAAMATVEAVRETEGAGEPRRAVPAWVRGRARLLLGGLGVGLVTAALSHDPALAAAIGAAEIVLHLLLDRVLGARD